MSDYPQDKFTAPKFSGKWRYWGNSQTITSSGSILPITKDTGVININQDNLFINYDNKELGVFLIGVIAPLPVCVNGKTDTVWGISSVNTIQTQNLTYNPYCYKNGVPTKMVSFGPTYSATLSTPITIISIFYYEKL
jgi:hypothetical protein